MAACPAVARLRLGDLRAEHDVAEQPGRGSAVLGARGAARPSGSSARRSARARPSTARAAGLHGALVDQHDRQLGVGVHAHLLERVA